MTDSIKADRVPVICRVMHIAEVYEDDALFREGRVGLTVAYDEGRCICVYVICRP